MTLNMSHSQPLKNIMDKILTDQSISWSVIFYRQLCIWISSIPYIPHHYILLTRGAFLSPLKKVRLTSFLDDVNNPTFIINYYCHSVSFRLGYPRSFMIYYYLRRNIISIYVLTLRIITMFLIIYIIFKYIAY